MNLRKKILICLLVSFFSMVPSALAKTTVEKENSDSYKVDVKIVFDFQGRDLAKNADTLISKWSEGMNEIWDGAQMDGKKIHFVFELIKMDSGKWCADYPDYHCVEVVSGDCNERGNISDVTFTSPNSGLNSQGEWSSATTGLNAAHEAGHLLGLYDEYHYALVNNELNWVSDSNQTNGKSNIMAQTWGDVTASGSDINKILSYAE
jgi:hypothetical protein